MKVCYGAKITRPSLHGNLMSDGYNAPYVPPLWPVYVPLLLIGIAAWFNPLIILIAIPSFLVAFVIGILTMRI